MTVSEQIIQVIDALCEKFGIAMNWTGENVIPYLEVLCGKLITYEIITSIFSIAIWVVIMISSIVATKKLCPKYKNGIKKDKENYDCGWTVLTVFSIIALVVVNFIGICTIESNVVDIIKCATIPEMYIFEYISALVNAG